ncbi:MAG: VWA domain-containing protein [Planctomycetes bacterium]|nr:VWA domain-containing protein [Planctomycetota bacterium]
MATSPSVTRRDDSGELSRKAAEAAGKRDRVAASADAIAGAAHRKAAKPAGATPTPTTAAKAAPAAAAPPNLHIDATPAQRSWLQDIVHSGVSWFGSFAVHAAGLVALALMTINAARQETLQVLEVSRRPDEQLSTRLEEEIDPAQTLSFSSALGNPDAVAAVAAKMGAAPQLNRRVLEQAVAPSFTLADVSLRSIPTERLTVDLGALAPGDPSAVVDGYGQAMDRITQELMMMLGNGDVLVIWLFDQSESMKDDQKEIKDRINRVYAELGLSDKVSKGDALLTAIASFGKGFQVHTKTPTADSAKIAAAINSVPVDPSGEEQTCRAIAEVIRQHKKYAVQGRRQLALVLVSDESGDDGEYVEQSITEARNARCRVYVLGREACFGYPYVHFRWTHKETGIVFWQRVNRGPETAFVEQLQTEGLWRRYDSHPSGFGPYEQVRLARETGGVFFMLPTLETNLVRGEKREYELDAMRPYLPDLSSRAEYAKARDKEELRDSLWKIIATLNPWQNTEINLHERLPLNREQFVKAATQEQQRAKSLITLYDAAEARLKELAPLREQEVSPRWQANYDLLYAQVMAYKVRVYEYGAVLEQFKKNPKPVKDKKTNEWEAEYRRETVSDETTKAYQERATQMFKDVIAMHPGTPYAARAQWELRRGFGIDFREWYEDPRRAALKDKVPKL